MTPAKPLRSVLILVLCSFAFTTGSAHTQSLPPGSRVFAQWAPNSWYPGSVESTFGNGYHIRFDDGDEKNCASQEVVEDKIPSPGQVKKGSQVLARWTDNKFYPGSVAAVRGERFQIAFDDGDSREVDLASIRLRQIEDPELREGMRVFAEWQPNSWYPGKIGKIANDRYHINFDDGDQKTVTRGQVVADRAPPVGSISLGADVLAQWNDGRYYPGKVHEISGGRYTIFFEDGDHGTATLEQLRVRSSR